MKKNISFFVLGLIISALIFVLVSRENKNVYKPCEKSKLSLSARILGPTESKNDQIILPDDKWEQCTPTIYDKRLVHFPCTSNALFAKALIEYLKIHPRMTVTAGFVDAVTTRGYQRGIWIVLKKK